MNPGDEPKPNIVPLREKDAKPLNLQEEIEMLMPPCLEQIGAMEYAGAFGHFADKLGEFERRLGEDYLEEPAQKPLRAAFKQLWKAYLADSTDSKKKRERLSSFGDATDEAVKAAFAQRDALRKLYDNLPPNQKAYVKAHMTQRGATGAVAIFPNAASEQAQLDRTITTQLDAFIAPINAAYEPEMQHIEYIGALFNDVLPMLRKQMEGYVDPMLGGWRSSSNYLPVTEQTVQANIVAFLEQATGLAQTLGKLQLARDKANSDSRWG